jgi:di/tricarboxylate transporter
MACGITYLGVSNCEGTVVAAGFRVAGTERSERNVGKPAAAVLLSPIAYNTPINLGMSTYPLFMTIAVSTSSAFLCPVGHSANINTMIPGGYRFKDYIKVGLLLTLVVIEVLLVILPVFWPYF